VCGIRFRLGNWMSFGEEVPTRHKSRRSIVPWVQPFVQLIPTATARTVDYRVPQRRSKQPPMEVGRNDEPAARRDEQDRTVCSDQSQTQSILPFPLTRVRRPSHPVPPAWCDCPVAEMLSVVLSYIMFFGNRTIQFIVWQIRVTLRSPRGRLPVS